jgi:hypothetical protein
VKGVESSALASILWPIECSRRVIGAVQLPTTSLSRYRLLGVSIEEMRGAEWAAVNRARMMPWRSD